MKQIHTSNKDKTKQHKKSVWFFIIIWSDLNLELSNWNFIEKKASKSANREDRRDDLWSEKQTQKNQEQGEREQGNHSFVRERKSEDVSEERLNESARHVREAQSNVGLF